MEEVKQEEVKQPEVEMIFQIMFGDDEFYSSDAPALVDAANVRGYSLVRKAVLNEKVLNQEMEQFYGVKEEGEFRDFSLVDGVVLRKVPAMSLTWFHTTKEEAELKLKDEVLMFYQTVVPQLLQRVNALEGVVNGQGVDDSNIATRKKNLML